MRNTISTDYNENLTALSFKAGLTIAGQNDDGETEWIGTVHEWDKLTYLTNQL